MDDYAADYLRMCEGVSAQQQADQRWRVLLSHFLHVIGVSEPEPASRAAINQILGSSTAPTDATALWSLLCGFASWKAIGKPLEPVDCPLQPRDLELCRTVIDGQAATVRLYDAWFPILVRYFTRFGCPAYECKREDYVSATWMAIVKSAANPGARYVPRPGASFGSWVYAVARQSWLYCLKRHGLVRVFRTATCRGSADFTTADCLTLLVRNLEKLGVKVDYPTIPEPLNNMVNQLLERDYQKQVESATAKEAERAQREHRDPKEVPVKRSPTFECANPKSLAGLQKCLLVLLRCHGQTGVKVVVIVSGKGDRKRSLLEIRSTGSRRSYSLFTPQQQDLLNEGPANSTVVLDKAHNLAKFDATPDQVLSIMTCARKLLRELPEQSQKAVVLFFLKKEGTEIIAASLKMTVEPAKSDITKVRMRMAACHRASGISAANDELLREIFLLLFERYPEDFPWLKLTI